MQNYNIEKLREILDELIACKADQQEIYKVSVELDKLIEGYYVEANIGEKQYL
ncbi:Spo0E family sporulation regulatory protein-aspartic acid phosphatase [Vallitalea pronyensis]|uniref:Spo0E family sporulation regulatory protein-aspartic acid phosphatase n=1 Tax=Vallitalea pronyensis TaxID=1348613 RepID=A0A8J8ML16_9FIRM|nr:Spo0E family sporulation regulatory protein-aspartic acid phosphatase [Vallitalea pronyensis]QUI23198.1 Spo0E family sporulation regulatory protein-aspartic acid phosphatase [Vallitalea pronyensis]